MFLETSAKTASNVEEVYINITFLYWLWIQAFLKISNVIYEKIQKGQIDPANDVIENDKDKLLI